MPRKFLYTVTTGRSGTVFLTEFLKANRPEARVYHERFGFQHFGINCPDASHSTTFNSLGNTDKVQSFWNKKLDLDQQHKTDEFIEISHVLAKAGLIENLHYLPDDCEIHLVGLKRDVFKIMWSYINRFDFINPGFTWLFALDSRYPNAIINSAPFQEQGMFGNALWYVYEVFARMEYYRLLTADIPNIHFHECHLEDLIKPQGAKDFLQAFLGEPPAEIKMPGKQNATKQEFFGEKEKQAALALTKKYHCDPAALGAKYFNSGRRLGNPTHLFRQRVIKS